VLATVVAVPIKKKKIKMTVGSLADGTKGEPVTPKLPQIAETVEF